MTEMPITKRKQKEGDHLRQVAFIERWPLLKTGLTVKLTGQD